MTDIEKIQRRFALEAGHELEIPAALFGTGFAGLFVETEQFDAWVSKNLNGWEYREEWANGYRSVYVNRELRAILTYVEGDVDLTVDADVETFEKRLKSAEEFYSKSN